MSQISERLEAQKKIFKSQKTKDISFRLSLLKKLKKEIQSQEKAIVEALYMDFKKSKFETYVSEFGLVISELNLAIKNLKKWSKPKRILPSILSFPSSDYIHKAPYGNVLIIAPWNYPFLLAIEPLIMAIAAGNTVVLKPSELSKNTSKLLTQIISNVFPENIAISMEGGVEVASELLAQKWDYIFFTGSTKVGKIVALAAAKHLTPITLELGGKSPCIIDDTMSLKLVARRLVWGKLLNGGQTCIAPDYVIVKSNIKEQLLALLKQEIIKSYGNQPNNSPDYPRIINKNNLLRLKSLLKKETIVFGGKVIENDNYIAPTLIDEPNLDSKVMTEEIFGPILPILTYKKEEDINHIINHFERPLAFYVFSKNKLFIRRMLSTFDFGGGVINDVLIHFGNPRLPFGGIGASGIGSHRGKHGFNTFTHEKSIIKRGSWFDPSFRYAPYKGKMGLVKKVFKYFG